MIIYEILISHRFQLALRQKSESLAKRLAELRNQRLLQRIQRRALHRTREENVIEHYAEVRFFNYVIEVACLAQYSAFVLQYICSDFIYIIYVSVQLAQSMSLPKFTLGTRK